MELCHWMREYSVANSASCNSVCEGDWSPKDRSSLVGDSRRQLTFRLLMVDLRKHLASAHLLLLTCDHTHTLIAFEKTGKWAIDCDGRCR